MEAGKGNSVKCKPEYQPDCTSVALPTRVVVEAFIAERLVKDHPDCINERLDTKAYEKYGDNPVFRVLGHLYKFHSSRPMSIQAMKNIIKNTFACLEPCGTRTSKGMKDRFHTAIAGTLTIGVPCKNIVYCWDTIFTILLATVAVASHALQQRRVDLICQIAQWCLQFLAKYHMQEWIDQMGGWENLLIHSQYGEIKRLFISNAFCNNGEAIEAGATPPFVVQTKQSNPNIMYSDGEPPSKKKKVDLCQPKQQSGPCQQMQSCPNAPSRPTKKFCKTLQASECPTSCSQLGSQQKTSPCRLYQSQPSSSKKCYPPQKPQSCLGEHSSAHLQQQPTLNYKPMCQKPFQKLCQTAQKKEDQLENLIDQFHQQRLEPSSQQRCHVTPQPVKQQRCTLDNDLKECSIPIPLFQESECDKQPLSTVHLEIQKEKQICVSELRQKLRAYRMRVTPPPAPLGGSTDRVRVIPGYFTVRAPPGQPNGKCFRASGVLLLPPPHLADAINAHIGATDRVETFISNSCQRWKNTADLDKQPCKKEVPALFVPNNCD